MQHRTAPSGAARGRMVLLACGLSAWSCVGALGCGSGEPSYAARPPAPGLPDASSGEPDAQTSLSMQPSAAASDAGPLLSSSKEITAFSIAGVAGTIGEHSILLTVPHDTHLRNITPELEYRGAALAPRAIDPQDFTKDVSYSVMAQDGSTRDYTVKVTVAPNNNHAITHFRIFGIESSIDGDQIYLTLPAGSDLTQLVPAITLSGGTVSPATDTVQDFSKPVGYTVTGADGSTQRYTVHVTLELGSATDIESFVVPGAVTTFHGDEIALSVPYGASACVGAPSIVHAGASIEPASGTAQDFDAPVTYTVTASDGSKRSYTAACDIAQSSARGISHFEVLGLPASIIGDEITLSVPNATSLGALTPAITYQGVRIEPASAAAQSFYAPVDYKLLEADGSLHRYQATIVLADRSDKELIGLDVQGMRAAISGDQVTLTLPAGSDTRALAPRVLQRGARLIPLSGTLRDFSASPLTYTVVARDGSRRDYTVQVLAAGPAAKELSQLELLGMAASISGSDVSVRVPSGSDLRALAPSWLQHTGVSISPPMAAIQDFTKPVAYTVTAADGSSQVYTVHASVSDASAAELLGVRILGVDATITGDQVRLQLPAATDLHALVPSLQTTALQVSPQAGVPQDFSQPVRYELTAADGSKHAYDVAVE